MAGRLPAPSSTTPVIHSRSRIILATSPTAPFPWPRSSTTTSTITAAAASTATTPCDFASHFASATDFGQQRRNQLYGPNYTDFDLDLSKSFKIVPKWESARLKVAAQFFNMFNHPNFQIPFADVNNSEQRNHLLRGKHAHVGSGRIPRWRCFAKVDPVERNLRLLAEPAEKSVKTEKTGSHQLRLPVFLCAGLLRKPRAVVPKASPQARGTDFLLCFFALDFLAAGFFAAAFAVSFLTAAFLGLFFEGSADVFHEPRASLPSELLSVPHRIRQA